MQWMAASRTAALTLSSVSAGAGPGALLGSEAGFAARPTAGPIDQPLLRKYIMYARQHFRPAHGATRAMYIQAAGVTTALLAGVGVSLRVWRQVSGKLQIVTFVPEPSAEEDALRVRRVNPDLHCDQPVVAW